VIITIYFNLLWIPLALAVLVFLLFGFAAFHIWREMASEYWAGHTRYRRSDDVAIDYRSSDWDYVQKSSWGKRVYWLVWCILKVQRGLRIYPPKPYRDYPIVPYVKKEKTNDAG
jgi:hypothetical protein